MSNDVNDIKKYLDTIGAGHIPVQEGAVLTEATLSRNDFSGEQDLSVWAEDLGIIGEQIQELLEEAREIIRGTGQHMAEKRAESYWIAHIEGAIGIHSKGSMYTLRDTVSELEGNDGESE